ncbi:hypothetical protein FRC10_005054 [Ceratobasidium sp. 414]|nr:hypothetical protein FRC10_005054 [Ceratobasidium sp. 414]
MSKEYFAPDPAKELPLRELVKTEFGLKVSEWAVIWYSEKDPHMAAEFLSPGIAQNSANIPAVPSAGFGGCGNGRHEKGEDISTTRNVKSPSFEVIAHCKSLCTEPFVYLDKT